MLAGRAVGIGVGRGHHLEPAPARTQGQERQVGHDDGGVRVACACACARVGGRAASGLVRVAWGVVRLDRARLVARAGAGVSAGIEHRGAHRGDPALDPEQIGVGNVEHPERAALAPVAGQGQEPAVGVDGQIDHVDGGVFLGQDPAVAQIDRHQPPVGRGHQGHAADLGQGAAAGVGQFNVVDERAAGTEHVEGAGAVGC